MLPASPPGVSARFDPEADDSATPGFLPSFHVRGELHRREPHAMTSQAGTDRSLGAPGLGEVEQHSLARSVALHLVPGAMVATLFYLGGPLAISAGYPAIFAGVVAAAVVIVGGELRWLLREGHRRTRSWSIAAALPFRPGPFTWGKGMLTMGLFGWAFLAAVVMGSISGSIKNEFFAWMPEWALNPLRRASATPGAPPPGSRRPWVSWWCWVCSVP